MNAVTDASTQHFASTIKEIARQRDYSGRDAVILRDTAISFAELDRRADAVAAGLGSTFGSGCAIAFLSQSSPLLFEILLGSARSDNIFLPLNWRLSVQEMQEIVSLSAPVVLFADETFRDAADALKQSATAPLTLIFLDGDDRPDTDYARWRNSHLDLPPVATEPTPEALRLYTSGTTGRPKGVRLTHDNFSAIFRCFPQIGLDYQGGNVLVPLPLFHVAGIAISLNALAGGGTVVLANDANAPTLLDLIVRHKVTDAFLVPAILLSLVQQPGLAAQDFSFVQTIAYGAAPISEELLKQASALFGCDFIQLYGLTETTGTATFLPSAEHDAGKGLLRSCGRPSPGVEIRIVDENGALVPTGAVGEIQIRGANVTPGYWNDEDATAAAFCDGWFKTGDAGYFNAEGYLFLHDRIKDMIVTGGENVYPAEVENAIFGHPAVADVAVIGVPDPKWGEAVMAIIVVKPGCEGDPQSIIDWARERIAGYKLPKSVTFRDELPRTPSGKILRRELREAFWGDQARRIN
ncbi:o-succinylbenzoate--CoA ligase [Sphingobium chlorophenolicum L-1]|uniref:3-methylmercaptopropionyl-CoA ligase n=1 Tax=Sphingobium chlorophenolicum L-1 TaxID=690566 RepID=F6F390_SPHCR|nr:o-succinylbenzoate--CoA ligase [Sphingobium chlorophenolicum L-1]